MQANKCGGNQDVQHEKEGTCCQFAHKHSALHSDFPPCSAPAAVAVAVDAVVVVAVAAAHQTLNGAQRMSWKLRNITLSRVAKHHDTVQHKTKHRKS